MEASKPYINLFSYVCAFFGSKKVKRDNFSEDFIEAYEVYFKQQIIVNADGVPNIGCRNCIIALWIGRITDIVVCHLLSK